MMTEHFWENVLKLSQLLLFVLYFFVKKGPNYTWHLDGYDKLKPYGFCIHGCMDG